MSVRSGTRPEPAWRARLRALLRDTTLAGRPLEWYLSGWRLALILLVVMVIFPWLVGSTFVADAIAVGIYITLAVGLNIVVGYAGLLDLGYVAFFAIGSYAEATGTFGALQLNSVTGEVIHTPVLPFWPLLVIGALVAGIFGIVLGAPTLRLRGDYLAIVTLGFGEIVPILFNYFPFWFGNTGMSALPPADINLGGLTITFSDPLNRIPFYYVVLAVVALVILGSFSLRDSSLGRAWVAIREDETAAASSGVNLVRTKLLAFGLGATMGGLGGVLNGAYIGAISPNDFPFFVSITVLMMIVLGGIGSIWGVTLGAIILRFIDVDLLGRISQFVQANPVVNNPVSPLHFLSTVDFNQAKYLIYGIMLLLMILFRPQGIIPDVRRRRELKGIGAAVESTSAIGVLEREEAGAELAAVDTLDQTTYAGPGSDDIGRSGD
ncbi:MAG TPA: branched-chain amino acid ABC transporter permease [Ktedonobacterales bacterium]|jgi:ABC-type branched-subunit amino acid transport system permease subunit